MFKFLPKSLTDLFQNLEQPDEGDALGADIDRTIRFGFKILAYGLGGFVLWAVLVPLGEGVPAPGTVAIADKSKIVQHLQGGIVKDVLVKEGDWVKKDDVLLRLDPAEVLANYQTVRQQFFGLRAMEGRLIAEQTDLEKINFDQDLLNASIQDPIIKQHIVVQEQLLQSRRDALHASIFANNAQIKGLEAQIKGFQDMIASRTEHYKLLSIQLAGLKDLVAEGYAPRNQQFEMQNQMHDISAFISENQSQQLQARHSISQIQQQTIALQTNYQKEVNTMLQDVRREVDGLQERYRAAQFQLQRLDIKAPASGQVVGLTTHTVGGVIQAGSTLMTIVPENEPLIVETKVPPQFIDRIHANDMADISFSTFAHSPLLVVKGLITSISADVLMDDSTKTSYYLVRIAITDEGMQKLGNRQMQPGMPVQVVIKTGERTLMNYLLHPFSKRISAALREE